MQLSSIAIGSDHAGYDLKENIKEYLKSKGIEVIDFGTNSKDSVDYPDFAVRVAHSIRDHDHPIGILICGSGVGMSITANKVKTVRAALCTSTIHARMSRLHNNANVLTMGERYTDFNLARKIVDTFLETEFTHVQRHERRVKLIETLTDC